MSEASTPIICHTCYAAGERNPCKHVMGCINELKERYESELAAARAENAELRKRLLFVTDLVVTAERERDDACVLAQSERDLLTKSSKCELAHMERIGKLESENQVLREALKSLVKRSEAQEKHAAMQRTGRTNEAILDAMHETDGSLDRARQALKIGEGGATNAN